MLTSSYAVHFLNKQQKYKVVCCLRARSALSLALRKITYTSFLLYYLGVPELRNSIKPRIAFFKTRHSGISLNCRRNKNRCKRTEGKMKLLLKQNSRSLCLSILASSYIVLLSFTIENISVVNSLLCMGQFSSKMFAIQAETRQSVCTCTCIECMHFHEIKSYLKIALQAIKYIPHCIA